MIKKIINNIKLIEKNTLKIMLKGFKISLIICSISCIILFSYMINPIHILYDAGTTLFKTGLTFASMFFVCAFAIDNIKKQLI